jgi:hypothetical protein
MRTTNEKYAAIVALLKTDNGEWIEDVNGGDLVQEVSLIIDEPTAPEPVAFATTLPQHQQRFARILNELIESEDDRIAELFSESLEGYAAAAAAASMLGDWESSDDGTGYLTAVVKRGDVTSVIEILQRWARLLTDTPKQEGK